MQILMRALACGLGAAAIAGAVGYSVPSAAPAGPAVESRALREPLAFTTPLAGTNLHDLGDAQPGRDITRFVTAKGGFPPRRFSADKGNSNYSGTTSLPESIAALPPGFSPNQSTAVLFLDGAIKGHVGAATTGFTDTPLRFDVTVYDSKPNTPNKVTEQFQLNLVDASTFKFAQSQLAGGVSFKPYREKLEVIGGQGPFKFTASDVSVIDVSGGESPKTSLEDVGLFLVEKTGRLVGRPLVPGTVKFTASATDKNGLIAKSRDKSVDGQQFSLPVADNPRVSSALFATAITIKGDIATAGKDTITYSGLIDLDGAATSTLAGEKLVLTIGGYTSPEVALGADGKGKLSSTGADMTASISADGQVRITIKDERFGVDEDIIKDGQLVLTQKVLPVVLEVGDSYSSSELLKFQVRARASSFQLTYKFGPGNLGGGFFITSVTGKDAKDTGPNADSWLVNFMTVPLNEDRVTSGVQATVGIGTDFTDTIAVSAKGDRIASSERRDATQPKVLKFSLDAKAGKGLVATGPLPQNSAALDTATGIPESLTSNGKRQRFPLYLLVTDPTGKKAFGAEGARAVFPKGSQWVSKNLNR